MALPPSSSHTAFPLCILSPSFLRSFPKQWIETGSHLWPLFPSLSLKSIRAFTQWPWSSLPFPAQTGVMIVPLRRGEKESGKKNLSQAEEFREGKRGGAGGRNPVHLYRLECLWIATPWRCDCSVLYSVGQSHWVTESLQSDTWGFLFPRKH